MSARPSNAPAECAQCGGGIPRKTKACPHCGADERTGWRETSVYDGMELPDEAWTDEDGEESGAAESYDPQVEKGRLPWYWTAVALMMIGVLVLWALWAWSGFFLRS